SCCYAELVQNPADLCLLKELGVPGVKLTLRGNGVGLRRFDPASISAADTVAAGGELGARAPTDVVVGAVGRLVREKGYPEVFEAARRLRARMPHVRFAVIGGDDAAKSDALSARDLVAAEAAGVRLLGARDDVV